MKKEIFLVMIYEPAQIKVPPFSLMYLSRSLKNAGYQTKILHCPKDKMQWCIEEISKSEPLFVGFSVLTGLPTLYSLQMSKKLKKIQPQIPIIWGGVHPSLLPEQCLKEEYIDYVAIGEGEETVVEFANALQKKKGMKKIGGLGFKKNKKLFINKKRPGSKNINKFKMDFDLDLSEYIIKRVEKHNGKNYKIRSLGYYSSRGCPHDCSFCYNNSFHKRNWRACDINSVVSDIKYLIKKYDINEVQFWDDNFWVDKKRAIEILKKVNIFSGSEIRIDYITEDLAKKLKELKVNYLLIGAESGSDRMLNLINKNFSSKLMFEKIKILAKNNLSAQYSFILGLPTENRTELLQTIAYMLKIKKAHKKASFTVGVYMPYPGTQLFEKAVKLGYQSPQKTEDWYTVDRWSNTLNLPWLDSQICLNIRHLFAMLEWSFPIKLWAKIRLKMKWLRFKQDLRAIIFFNILRKKLLTSIK